MATEERNFVIIGGGIAGASTAYYLSRHPSFTASRHKITILEAQSVASKSSGKSGGFLAKDWHGSATTPLSVLSFKLHEELAVEHGGKERWGFRKVNTHSVQLGPFSGGAKRSKAGTPGWVGGNSVCERHGILGTTETTAQVSPFHLTNALVELSGAEVVIGVADKVVFDSDQKVSGVVYEKDGSSGSLKTQDVILAAGPWLGSLSTTLFPRSSPVSSSSPIFGVSGSGAHSVILRPATKEAETAIGPDALFTHLEMDDGSAGEPEVYPRPDGTVYVCGESTSAPLPHSPLAPISPSPKSIAKLVGQSAFISSHLQNAKVEKEQLCYLPMSEMTGVPVLGKVKGVEGLWAAGGGSCWGVTQGPGMGKCLAEIIFDGVSKSANVNRLSP